MSTICKLDPNVRSNRAFRRNVRRNLAATFDYLMVRGQIIEAAAVSAVIKRVRLLTNHRAFMSALNEATGPGPSIIPEGANAVASA